VSLSVPGKLRIAEKTGREEEEEEKG